MSIIYPQEPNIVARIQDKIPGLVVMTARDLIGVKEESLPRRSVHVFYDGIVGVDDNGADTVKITTAWTVAVAVEMLKVETASDAKAEASELMIQLIRSLIGFRPAIGNSKLKLTRSPREEYSDMYGYFPIKYTTYQVVESIDDL